MLKTVCQSVAWFKRYKALKSVTVGRSVGSLNLRKLSENKKKIKTRSAFGLARNNFFEFVWPISSRSKDMPTYLCHFWELAPETQRYLGNYNGQEEMQKTRRAIETDKYGKRLWEGAPSIVAAGYLLVRLCGCLVSVCVVRRCAVWRGVRCQQGRLSHVCHQISTPSHWRQPRISPRARIAAS